MIIFLDRKKAIGIFLKNMKYIHGIADTYAYCLMPNHFHLMVK